MLFHDSLHSHPVRYRNHDPKLHGKFQPSQDLFAIPSQSCLVFCPFCPIASKCSLELHDVPSGSVSVLLYCSPSTLCEALHNVRLAVEIAVECYRGLSFCLSARKRVRILLGKSSEKGRVDRYLEVFFSAREGEAIEWGERSDILSYCCLLSQVKT